MQLGSHDMQPGNDDTQPGNDDIADFYLNYFSLSSHHNHPNAVLVPEPDSDHIPAAQPSRFMPFVNVFCNLISNLQRESA